MNRALISITVFLMVTIPSFAGGISGVWEQNPFLHNYQGDSDAIVFWQFTEDGQFRYEESCLGQLRNAMQGRYSLSGSSLTLTIENVIYHHYENAASFLPGMTLSIEVSISDNEMIFSANPFAEVATPILNRISNYSRYSPEDVMPATWTMGYMMRTGELDSDEDNATRLNSDHTLFYVWEGVGATGTWSISSDGKLCWVYEKSDNNDDIEVGYERNYPILICCPERVSLHQNDVDNAMPVFTPDDGSLIDQYFGSSNVNRINADTLPRIITSGNTIQIENAYKSSMVVFDIDGKIVITRQSYDGKPIYLPSGFYIVNINDTVFRVVL